MPFGDESRAVAGGRTARGYLSSGATPGVSSLFTGRYRDTELASSAMPSGLDYFGARHYAPAFGRFMQPDQPFADQDTADPQSWHLFGYARNNPFSYTDPTGQEVTCSGDGDNFRCVDNVPPPSPESDPWAPGGPLFDLWWNSLSYTVSTTAQIAQQVQPVASKVIDWLGQPRNMPCLWAATGAGAVAGATVGAAGLATGPGVVITEAGGFLGGGAVGFAGGMGACMSNGGPSSGGSPGQSADKAFWKSLKPFRGKTKTNGLIGKARRFFEWDHTHGDVEVYDAQGRHLGSANPDTGAMTKPAVPGRRIAI